jgi:hypothetical protein
MARSDILARSGTAFLVLCRGAYLDCGQFIEGLAEPWHESKLIARLIAVLNV